MADYIQKLYSVSGINLARVVWFQTWGNFCYCSNTLGKYHSKRGQKWHENSPESSILGLLKLKLQINETVYD